MKLLLTLTLASIIFLASGCMIIWTDHVFVGTLFKTVDAKDLGLVADPNQTRIGSGETKTENDNVKVITPYGVVETND